MKQMPCRASLTNCAVEYTETASHGTACMAKMCFLDTQPVGPYDRRVGLQSEKGVAVRATDTFPFAPGFPRAVIGPPSSVPAFFNYLDC